MTWLSPGFLRLAALLFLVVTIAGLVGYVTRRRRTARLFGDPALLLRLVGEDLAAIPWRRVVPVGLGVVALSLALIDPRLPPEPPSGGAPVVLVMDASGSMLAEDVVPRRLELQRALARDLVRELPEVPIGIVAFAGRAYSLTPPTRDRSSLDMYIATVDPTIVTQTGSALGAAIRQGMALLGAGGGSGRGGTIVLLSDGDETEDAAAAREAAALARRIGARIHTVGIGTAAGGTVPALDLTTGEAEGVLRGPDAQPLVTRLDEDLLRGIARGGNGIYVRGGEPGAVERLGEEVRGLTAREGGGEGGGVPAYVWLAGAALMLLTLEPLGTGLRRGREG
jgi:Ca-activated chloride channel homolog